MRKLAWVDRGLETWALAVVGAPDGGPLYKYRACTNINSGGDLIGSLWAGGGTWSDAASLPDTSEEAQANMKQILMTMCRLGMDDGP